MGRDRTNVARVQAVERKLRNNVIRRLSTAASREDRADIENAFRELTYDLIVAREADFASSAEVHPSEFGECKLRLAFALRGLQRKAPPMQNQKLILTFNIGTAIHGILQGRYGLLGERVKFTPEVGIDSTTSEIAERYCITGHCDGIFEDLRSGRRLGLEIKSISGKGFAALSEPSDHYKNQATIYMACLGLDNMMFVFVDKNTSLIQPVLYPFDKNRWEDITKVLDAVMLKVVTGGAVSKAPNRMVCLNMCNYYWYCKPGV